MLLPDWITEARIAILIASASALFSWRLARNDTLKMRRKKPSFELDLCKPKTAPDGWLHAVIVVRNLDNYSIDLLSISTRRAGQQICLYEDAWVGNPNFFIMGDSALKMKPTMPGASSLEIKRRLEPCGNTSNRSVLKLSLYARGVIGLSDLRFQWSWADGHQDASLFSKLRPRSRPR